MRKHVIYSGLLQVDVFVVRRCDTFSIPVMGRPSERDEAETTFVRLPSTDAMRLIPFRSVVLGQLDCNVALRLIALESNVCRQRSRHQP
jgi:hypothetical protein